MHEAWTQAYQELGEVIFPAPLIQARVAELAARISADYAGRPLHLVAVLRGALPFVADLSRRLDLDVSFDFVFLSRTAEPNGHVRLLKDLEGPIEGRHVLVVEDLVNEGHTLSYLLEMLKLRGPATLGAATMFDRPYRRAGGLQIEYVGLEVPEDFVVGYGLDYRQRYRNLPFLATLRLP
ncbi:MAG TPA: hypoxanthine phosphoribosyltransferase [Candidatus Nitrosotenuis sp.]|jgi:hypoxanthine phosphoribosyltransferase|nr:hypoxanthine phosphoribosyltransferase [Candidatus Nitrosotenuis sp.]